MNDEVSFEIVINELTKQIAKLSQEKAILAALCAQKEQKLQKEGAGNEVRST